MRVCLLLLLCVAAIYDCCWWLCAFSLMLFVLAVAGSVCAIAACVDYDCVCCCSCYCCVCVVAVCVCLLLLAVS